MVKPDIDSKYEFNKLILYMLKKYGGLINNGINITAGIPIIRTSVDHGTGEDIAGKGIASDESLLRAINLAYKMSINQ